MGRRKKGLKNELNDTFSNIATGFSGLFQISKSVANRMDILGEKRRQYEGRLIYLRNKYGDEGMVQALMQNRYWIGQSSEQLRDALGVPVAIDDKQLKTIKRELWKYYEQGKNRYRLRITVEDDKVVGWDHKN